VVTKKKDHGRRRYSYLVAKAQVRRKNDSTSGAYQGSSITFPDRAKSSCKKEGRDNRWSCGAQKRKIRTMPISKEGGDQQYLFSLLQGDCTPFGREKKRSPRRISPRREKRGRKEKKTFLLLDLKAKKKKVLYSNSRPRHYLHKEKGRAMNSYSFSSTRGERELPYRSPGKTVHCSWLSI